MRHGGAHVHSYSTILSRHGFFFPEEKDRRNIFPASGQEMTDGNMNNTMWPAIGRAVCPSGIGLSGHPSAMLRHEADFPVRQHAGVGDVDLTPLLQHLVTTQQGMSSYTGDEQSLSMSCKQIARSLAINGDAGNMVASSHVGTDRTSNLLSHHHTTQAVTSGQDGREMRCGPEEMLEMMLQHNQGSREPMQGRHALGEFPGMRQKNDRNNLRLQQQQWNQQKKLPHDELKQQQQQYCDDAISGHSILHWQSLAQPSTCSPQQQGSPGLQLPVCVEQHKHQKQQQQVMPRRRKRRNVEPDTGTVFDIASITAPAFANASACASAPPCANAADSGAVIAAAFACASGCANAMVKGESSSQVASGSSSVEDEDGGIIGRREKSVSPPLGAMSTPILTPSPASHELSETHRRELIALLSRMGEFDRPGGCHVSKVSSPAVGSRLSSMVGPSSADVLMQLSASPTLPSTSLASSRVITESYNPSWSVPSSSLDALPFDTIWLPPSACPLPPFCHGLLPSREVFHSMGAAATVAERPLSMTEVKSLVLAVVEAMVEGSKDAIDALLRELEAASCPVGPASQRTAYYFSTALKSRVNGDALQRYLEEVPSDPQAFEQAYMHYTARVPFSHFITLSCLTAVSQALSLEYEYALESSRRRPEERVHIIDTNMESAFVWLVFLRQLADRPQGPPRSVRITLLDVVPPIVAGRSQGRRARAMQLKEQLSVQAVVVGIEEFECDVIVCSSSRIAEGVAQVRVNMEERAQRWREESNSFAYCRSVNGPWSSREGDRFVSKKHRRVSTGGRKRRRGPVEPPLAGSALSQGIADAGSAGGPCANAGGGVSRGGNHSGDPPVVDFLAVISIMRLTELFNEAGPSGELSPRDTYLKWVHSLHPNVFVATETSNDASGPFSTSRISRVFDNNANHIHANDLFCAQPASGGQRKVVDLLVSEAAEPELTNGNRIRASNLFRIASEQQRKPSLQEDERAEVADNTVGEGADSQSEPLPFGYRFGLPQSRLRALPGMEEQSNFRQVLDRQHMVVFERFLFMRSLLVVVAMEGEQRYIRPWSHEQWVEALTSHGFVLSPVVPTMAQQLCRSASGYPEHVEVTPITGGVSSNLCGREALCTTVWTV